MARSRPTCKELVLERLGASVGPLALHELGIIGHSPISIQRRLYELKAEGKVSGMMREGKNFMEWRLIPHQPEFPQIGDNQPVIARGGVNGELDLKEECCGSCGRRGCICRTERELEREEARHHDRY